MIFSLVLTWVVSLSTEIWGQGGRHFGSSKAGKYDGTMNSIKHIVGTNALQRPAFFLLWFSAPVSVHTLLPSFLPIIRPHSHLPSSIVGVVQFCYGTLSVLLGCKLMSRLDRGSRMGLGRKQTRQNDATGRQTTVSGRPTVASFANALHLLT